MMDLLRKKTAACLLCVVLSGTLLSCAGKSDSQIDPEKLSDSLTYTGSMELSYAQEFSVDYYEGGYALLTIDEDGQYLLVPEDAEAPEDLNDSVTVLRQPLQNLYLAASAAMDMFIAIDGLDAVRFSGTDVDGWYLDEAVQAMESGSILYAGKYSAPDYERILSEGCSLAVENTMIYHTPEVKEELESFDIPVLVDHSSYEREPLGRTEWVKLYGLLLGREEEAEAAFKQQEEAFLAVSGSEDTGKSVAFFYLTSNGAANVRKSSDYLPRMIELAGGHYIFDDLGEEDDTATSTMTLQLEEFYAAAKDADYLIYNSTIEGELSFVDELIKKSSLLANFKAVREGHVYCTSKNLYQSSMELGEITADLHKMLTGQDDALTYLYPLN